jgi:hypothetical protein
MSTAIMHGFSFTLAEAASIAVDRDRPEDLARRDAEALTAIYSSLRQTIGDARAGLENMLGEGVETRTLKDLPNIVAWMGGLIERTASIVARWDEKALPDFLQNLLAEVKGLLAESRAFVALTDVVAEALALPPAPLDQVRAQAAWEAYERGETRPLEPGFLTRRK